MKMFANEKWMDQNQRTLKSQAQKLKVSYNLHSVFFQTTSKTVYFSFSFNVKLNLVLSVET